jgi:hypothetical protein
MGWSLAALFSAGGLFFSVCSLWTDLGMGGFSGPWGKAYAALLLASLAALLVSCSALLGVLLRNPNLRRVLLGVLALLLAGLAGWIHWRLSSS